MKLETNMIICLRTVNPEAFNSSIRVQRSLISMKILTRIEKMLIEEYNGAVTDAEKTAIISITKEYTLFELAEQMEQVLQTEIFHALQSLETTRNF